MSITAYKFVTIPNYRNLTKLKAEIDRPMMDGVTAKICDFGVVGEKLVVKMAYTAEDDAIGHAVSTYVNKPEQRKHFTQRTHYGNLRLHVQPVDFDERAFRSLFNEYFV